MHGPSNRRRSSRRFHSPRPTAPHAHAQSTQVPSPRPCGPQSLRRARGFTVVPSTLVVGRLALTGASQSVYCALPTVLWLWCRGSSYLFSSSPRRPHSSVLLALAVLVYLDRPVTHGNLRTTYTRLTLLIYLKSLTPYHIYQAPLHHPFCPKRPLCLRQRKHSGILPRRPCVMRRSEVRAFNKVHKIHCVGTWFHAIGTTRLHLEEPRCAAGRRA